jgi:uncharacterized membrane protein
MATDSEKTFTCRICGEAKECGEVLPGSMVRGSVLEMIRKKSPGFTEDDYICLKDLNRLRTEYVEGVLQEERGHLSKLEEQVIGSMQEHEILSQNINLQFEQEITLGERVADRVTEFGGSWTFIVTYLVLVAIWVAINSLVLLVRPFDPYPYIFLNLILSGLAGIQAPIILMSQNRQDAKDRMRSEHDYRLNLKAELEIRHLNEKMDMLLTHQWERLLEIQRIQMEVMEELAGKTPRPCPE